MHSPMTVPFFFKLLLNVEISFSTIGIKLDSLNKIEENRIQNHFRIINSRRIKKHDGENSAMIYYSTIKHNQIVDSLIIELNSILENEARKKKIVTRFEYAKTDLKIKLNSITEFKTKSKIDSILKQSVNLEILPKFTIISEFQNGKLNATKSAELLLKKLEEKTKYETKLKKN